MNAKRQKLSSKNFIYQMCRYGYLAEQIPPCFSSEILANHVEALKDEIRRSYSTSPVTLSAYKSNTERRMLAVPNPYSFLCTVKYFSEHWRQIVDLTTSINSESPITFIYSYRDKSNAVINSDLARSVLKVKSDFQDNLRNRIIASMGYKYRLSIDIATFYDSIYTHSLSWAICGKKEAKRMFPESARTLRTEKYNFANELDTRIRNQKSQETNGILTGPFTSRIASEIILVAIDKILQQKSYIFKRYVDDYKFYFRSEYEANKAIVDIAKILLEFNLNINHSKVDIKQYPFDIEIPIKQMFDNALNQSGTLGVLNEANRLHEAGNKGAYKYALKMIDEKGMDGKDKQVILSMLFNINLLDPKYARYIVNYLKNNLDLMGEEFLSDLINKELMRSIDEGYEQEILNLLFFLKVLNLKIEGKSLLKALSFDNDFIRIISLDYWLKKNDHVARSPREAQYINAYIKNLEKEFLDVSVDEGHWLLIYESKVHKLLKLNEFKGKTASFFNKMHDLGITFYL